MKDISWDDAKKIVADALQPLGEEYVSLYWKGFDEGWVDVYETVGKRGGAYSWGTYSSKPYLSMNYDGTLSDVSTLAHEYGHSIHSYLTRNTQPYAYGSYRTFIAEVASMTNEAILYQKMLKETKSKQEKIYLLQTYLDQFRGSFFRQASFADFEMQAHALVESGNGLTRPITVMPLILTRLMQVNGVEFLISCVTIISMCTSMRPHLPQPPHWQK